MSKPRKSVSKAASVLASDDSSEDAKSLAGSVLATSDDEPEPEAASTAFEAYAEAEAAIEAEEEPLVRFQDEIPQVPYEPEEIIGSDEPEIEYAHDLADSETLDEFPVMTAAELEAEGFGTVVEIAPEPEPEPVADHIAEAVAAAKEASGHVAVTPNVNRD